MDVTIRKAETRDIPGLIILNDEFNGCGATFDSMKASFESNNEIVYVAAVNGTVVGFICGLFWQSICYAEGFQGIITELFVNEDYRRNSIATKLIQALELEFVNHNVQEITLATPVTNSVGRCFYESCGYSDRKEMVYDKILGVRMDNINDLVL